MSFVVCLYPQGRQASIWGLLNHLRVTHPAAKVVPLHLKAQMAHGMGIQASHPLKPDRCAAMVSEDHAAAESAPVQHVVSIGPHGHIRCSVPGYASPRQHTASSRDCNHSAQQLHPAQASFKKGKPTKQSCEYHQRETLTVSLVNQPCVLAAPSRAVSPQRSQRVHAPCKEPASVDATSSTPYVRMVAIGPGYSRPEATAPVECHQQSSSQQRQQQHQQSHAAPERCPEPVAASPAGRKAALAQLRMARRRQQGGVVAKQKVQECMAARDRPGGGQQWSSRRKASQQPASLIDLGERSAKQPGLHAC